MSVTSSGQCHCAHRSAVATPGDHTPHLYSGTRSDARLQKTCNARKEQPPEGSCCYPDAYWPAGGLHMLLSHSDRRPQLDEHGNKASKGHEAASIAHGRQAGRHAIAVQKDEIPSGQGWYLLWLGLMPGLIPSHNAIKLRQDQVQHLPQGGLLIRLHLHSRIALLAADLTDAVLSCWPVQVCRGPFFTCTQPLTRQAGR